MIERCLLLYIIYAVYICVFEKKCCLSVQNTELQNESQPFVDYVFNTMQSDKATTMPPSKSKDNRETMTWLPILNPNRKSVATRVIKKKNFKQVTIHILHLSLSYIKFGYHCWRPLLKCGYRVATRGYQY